jgi:tetratricopeptide (TPR) repeat protein
MPPSKKPRKKPTVASPAKKTAAAPAQGAAALEALLASLRGGAGPADDAIDAAQDVIYDAWEAPTKKQRVALAWKALAISPLCADAYVLLAQEEAKNLEDARDLYAQGVKAGEQALGPEGFKEYRGRFWGFHETRPYMRARACLAATLAQLGDADGAIGHYREMLKLNPNDNQGIRYLLAAALMKKGDLVALGKLFRKHKDDGSAEWLYSRALLAFHEGGDCAEANVLATEAMVSNRHVPAVLAGAAKPKKRDDGYIIMGGEDEAAYYAEKWGEAWNATPGAVVWLWSTAHGVGSAKPSRKPKN